VDELGLVGVLRGRGAVGQGLQRDGGYPFGGGVGAHRGRFPVLLPALARLDDAGEAVLRVARTLVTRDTETVTAWGRGDAFGGRVPGRAAIAPAPVAAPEHPDRGAGVRVLAAGAAEAAGEDQGRPLRVDSEPRQGRAVLLLLRAVLGRARSLPADGLVVITLFPIAPVVVGRH